MADEELTETSDIYHNIVSCQYDEDWTRIITESAGHHEAEVKWKVQVDNPNMIGPMVLWQLRELIQKANAPLPNTRQYDPVPHVGQSLCRNDVDDYKVSTYFNHLGWQDSSMFCDRVTCELIKPDDPLTWRVTATYKPPEDAGPQVLGSLPLDDDPMKWLPVAWSEFVEDQIPIEEARCYGIFDPDLAILDSQKHSVTNEKTKFAPLTGIDRGETDGTTDEKMGPIVNAAGQQTVDPQMTTVYRMFYKIKVNYPHQFYASKLNRLFIGTVHGSGSYQLNPVLRQWDSTSTPLLQGYPHGTWKFVVAEPEPMNWRKVPNRGIVSYVPTVITFEIKMGKFLTNKDGNELYLPSLDPANESLSTTPNDYPVYSGWMRLVLNNGQTCFRKLNDKYPGNEGGFFGDRWVADPRFDTTDLIPVPQGSDPKINPRYKVLFPTTAMKFKEENLEKFAYDDKREPAEQAAMARDMPDITDFNEVETAEPVNLKYDGTQIGDPTEKPNHVWYRDLLVTNYDAITNYYGDKLVNDPLLPPVPHYPFGEKEDPLNPGTYVPISKCP